MSVIHSLKDLKGFLQDHHLSFSSGILILLTVGGEQIFQATVFNCPCTQPRAAVYGLIFLIIPAILLAMIGIAVSNLTWRVLHGCCYRPKEGRSAVELQEAQNVPGQKRASAGPVEGQPGQNPDGRVEIVNMGPQMVRSNGFKKAFVSLFTVFARSFVVPVTWLSLAFLDGNYYACVMSKEPCNKTSTEYIKFKEESQMISWILLLVVAVITFIVIGVTRCRDSVRYLQYKYISAYREIEEKLFEEKIKEHSQTTTKNQIRHFMQSPKREDWDAIALVPQLSGPSLSPLDEWHEMQPPERWKNAVQDGVQKSNDGQENRPVPQQSTAQSI